MCVSRLFTRRMAMNHKLEACEKKWSATSFRVLLVSQHMNDETSKTTRNDVRIARLRFDSRSRGRSRLCRDVNNTTTTGDTFTHTYTHKISIKHLNSTLIDTKLHASDRRVNTWITTYTKISKQKQTPLLESAGANYTDRATAACRRSQCQL
jgi:succinate dehydrogenase flavin-adding protein (antitoxin of CptAB toxin-antitoxin module)